MKIEESLINKKIDILKKVYSPMSEENLNEWNIVLNMDIDDFLDFMNEHK